MTSEHAKEATLLYAEGYNCSQSVFSVYAKENGLDPTLARKISTGFGGGVSRTGNICGAVSGAILAIGIANGMSTPDDLEGREKSYALDQKLIQKFTERFGSIRCPDLLGYNLAIPEEREEAKKKEMFKKVCPIMIAGAVEILDELL